MIRFKDLSGWLKTAAIIGWFAGGFYAFIYFSAFVLALYS